MRKCYLSILFFTLAINTIAQSDYDHIGLDEFYLMRTDSIISNISKVKFSELNNFKIIEQQFGKNYLSNRYQSNYDDRYYIDIKYADGLELIIPDTVNKRRSEVIFYMYVFKPICTV